MIDTISYLDVVAHGRAANRMDRGREVTACSALQGAEDRAARPLGQRHVIGHCSACGGACWSDDALDHGLHAECYATLHGHTVNLLA